jgi:lipoate-protein ligase A
MKKKGKWKFSYTGRNDAFMNMALDEALLISSQKKGAAPVLRLYQWEPKAVSFGYSQAIGRTLNSKKCQKMKIDFVRRITGGRAVPHDNDLTYSICASADYFDSLGESVNETYKRISLAFVESLKLLKIKGEFEKMLPQENRVKSSDLSKPCFSSAIRYEIKVNGRKLIGSAQRRFQNSFIQHGSIPLEDQSIDLVELLPHTSSVKKQRLKIKLNKESVCIRTLLGETPGMDRLISAVKSGFSSFFGVSLVDDDISAEELGLAYRLASKYKSEAWNFRR